MSPIKDFHLDYNVPNSEGAFSEGGALVGAVSFALTRELKVKRIQVKLKGDAIVSWEEGSGDDATRYSDRRTYFKVKKPLGPQSEGGSTLPPGLHNFNFTLAIPQGNFPSSFKGAKGKITYTLEAKISRSWRMPSTVQKELKFLSRSPANHVYMLRPYSRSLSKDVGVFSREKVHLFVTVSRNVFSPGEIAAVAVNISNQSSRKMRPKVKLLECVEYRAGSSRTATNRIWGKLVGDSVKGNSEGIFNFQVEIPGEIVPTIPNCEIISVEYYLKVYLDISFARDPEVQLPLMIVPSALAYLYTAAAGGAPTCSDFPLAEPSPFSGPPAPYFSPGLPSSQHQAPSAPSLLPDEGPPSYQSLWPPSNTFDALDQTKKNHVLRE